ncbi:MAG: Lipopolysaccharide export system permease protein LptG [Verrucomicrobiota bacterium]|jgi:lipopolysaccharide export system permease protein
MKLLDRYVLRLFLEPLFLCFGALLGISLIFDFRSNGDDLLRGATLSQASQYYLYQLPQVLMISLPWGLLWAVLFSLGRMSRSNEIIAMQSSGRSLWRVLLPLWGAGMLASLACVALNYELAPRSEVTRKAILEQIKNPRSVERHEGQLYSRLFRDRQNRRTWYIRSMNVNSPVLEGVQVLQQDAEGNIVRKWYANRAIHEPATGHWILQRGRVVDLNKEGQVQGIEAYDGAAGAAGQRVEKGWSETPGQIVAANLDPQQLTVPELQETLRVNADFPDAQLAHHRTLLGDRWALPWSCFVVVLIAAPLAVVYARRGAIQGIGWAILLFFLMMITRHLGLALGKGGRIPAALAAWGPQTLFGLIGLFLLWMRAGNRDLSHLFGRKS